MSTLPPLPSIVLRADAHYEGEALADAVREYAAQAVAAALKAQPFAPLPEEIVMTGIPTGPGSPHNDPSAATTPAPVFPAQVHLDADIAKILHDNLDSLYVEDDAQPEPAVPAEPVALLERLEGPHEWGYRDPVVGGFFEDNTPFEAAQEIKRLRAALAAQAEVATGWKEAAIGWEVCASIHRTWCKGKDPMFTTRQGDFMRHAQDARKKFEEQTGSADSQH